MEFRTVVDIPKSGPEIGPCEQMLFVGSCFADHIGRRFAEEKFRVTVNPYGVMYNPASILHTIERLSPAAFHEGQFPRVVFLTLGTNHVYRLRETGEIVDNCGKRPQALFQEEELTVDECAAYLRRAVDVLSHHRPDVHVVFTVSPIRYRKYGYHGSQLSKATLLLAISQLTSVSKIKSSIVCARRFTRLGDSTFNLQSSMFNLHLSYFPAYEIFMDELRDYRFYDADMLHPSEQAVDYIWERLSDAWLSPEARQFLTDWAPLKQALAHKPFHPESEEYRAFMDKTMLKVAALQKKYPNFAL